ncbi:MAG: phosphonate metabolism protein/1,5-bisphosphokinase (PRPP-forming) PhnN [Alphaproteobacteria bacterium]|nr:phosphonate metabolism protein/1,5-bisphosphokinase (PRPP-forming) PhnN [Alphaproteobacteria bacterium]
MNRSAAGALILVVGASGAGKDSLIAGARNALAPAERFSFPRREVTRPADSGGEPHVEIDEATFAYRVVAGAYALNWSAHGLCYGIPVVIDDHLAMGRHVVVNVSRGVLDQARTRYRRLTVIDVRVPADLLVARLAERGRETPAEIAGRLARAEAFVVSGADVVTFRNDRPLGEATGKFVRTLEAISRRTDSGR